jgi:hypothetical protein
MPRLNGRNSVVRTVIVSTWPVNGSQQLKGGPQGEQHQDTIGERKSETEARKSQHHEHQRRRLERNVAQTCDVVVGRPVLPLAAADAHSKRVPKAEHPGQHQEPRAEADEQNGNRLGEASPDLIGSVTPARDPRLTRRSRPQKLV